MIFAFAGTVPAALAAGAQYSQQLKQPVLCRQLARRHGVAIDH